MTSFAFLLWAAGAVAKILQLIVKSVLLSLSDQICLDSSVLFQWFLFRKENLCCV